MQMSQLWCRATGRPHRVAALRLIAVGSAWVSEYFPNCTLATPPRVGSNPAGVVLLQTFLSHALSDTTLGRNALLPPCCRHDPLAITSIYRATFSNRNWRRPIITIKNHVASEAHKHDSLGYARACGIAITYIHRATIVQLLLCQEIGIWEHQSCGRKLLSAYVRSSWQQKTLWPSGVVGREVGGSLASRHLRYSSRVFSQGVCGCG